MSALITVENVSSRYGEFQILHDVNFGVERATVHGLIGPNGAGKSTLLDVMTGSHPPFEGNVFYDGKDVSRRAPHEVARMGVRRTFQHPRLCWSWSLLENVMMGAPSEEPASLKADLAMTALRRVGLGALAMQQADRADGVTQLKTQIARCLIASPRVLILDEPSAGMDGRERTHLGALLLELASDGVTVLLVAHDLPLIRSCAHTVTVINAGKLIAHASAEAALADPRVRAAYLGVAAHA